MYKIIDTNTITDNDKMYITLMNYVHVKPKYFIINTHTKVVLSAWYNLKDAKRVLEKLKDYEFKGF